MEQWGWLGSEEWDVLFRSAESAQCVSSGINFVLAFTGGTDGTGSTAIAPKDSCEQQPEYELLDLRLARDMLNFSRSGKQGQEFTSFVRMLTCSLLQSKLFKRYKQLEDVPAEFFSGRDKKRFCSSSPIAAKFVEEMILSQELVHPPAC